MTVSRRRRAAGRRSVALGGTALLVTTVILPITTFGGNSGAVLSQLPTPATTLCGVSNPAQIEEPATPAPTNPVSTVVSNVAITNFTVANGDLYILSGGTVSVDTTSGQPISSFTLPFSQSNANTDMVVGPNGSVYLFGTFSFGWGVGKISPTGGLDWSAPTPSSPNGLLP